MVESVIESYAIGGGVGAQAYLTPMSTEDIDVFVAVKPEVAATLQPLQEIYASLAGRAKADGLYLVIGGWPVRFLVVPDLLHLDAVRTAVTREIGGEPARFMRPEYLAAIALKTGRPSDKARLLEFLQTGAVDRPALEEPVARHDLADRWSLFKRQILGAQ
ncbi:MAG: hypothetical protein HYX65_07090 [Gemmatimonadetes bacterium]|nr:hypothetical protein [Gemmatimonadota bacterium]